jgi:hypothetical protein
MSRDMEAVILKAVEKDRDHRYQTAAEFREDLERILNGTSVRARRTTAIARGAKWAVKNRSATLASAMVAALCVVSLATFHRTRTMKEDSEYARARMAAIERRIELTDPSTPLSKRIERVLWDGTVIDVRYKGKLAVEETQIGAFDLETIGTRIEGLAFHPDGRIAFSGGQGTELPYKVAFWSRDGTVTDIVALQHRWDKAASKEEHEKNRSQGIFWYFSGPMAFDREGNCYLSDGGGGEGGGIYLVKSSSPLILEKLVDAEPYSLQIPSFDPQHVYSTERDGIKKYPLSSSVEEGQRRWFAIDEKESVYCRGLVVSPSRVIVVAAYSPTGRGRTVPAWTVLVFDKDAAAFWDCTDYWDAMAVSWDGERMIRYEQTPSSIVEFRLGLGDR